MNFADVIRIIDVLHGKGSTQPRLAGRGLTGRVFGAELPAYVIFHAVLGYVILAVGLMALILRVPYEPIKRFRWLHPYLGLGWVLLTVYMPVTAIWSVNILHRNLIPPPKKMCVYVHPDWDVVAFFIFSMYITIAIGFILIRIWKSRTDKFGLGRPRSVAPPAKGVRALKWIHGGLMTYSIVMLLGAGISFPFRANSDYAVGGRFGPPE